MGMKPRPKKHPFKDWAPGEYRVKMHLVRPTGSQLELYMPHLGAASGDALGVLAVRIAGGLPTRVSWEEDGETKVLETGGVQDCKWVSITVNAEKHRVDPPRITYDQVVRLGKGFPEEGWDVTWKAPSGRRGTLLPGETLPLEVGMEFQVGRDWQ